MSNNTTKMFKSSVIIKIITLILSFVNTIVINRALGTVLRGEYTFIINAANMLQLILNLGIGYSYSYFSKKGLEKSKQIFSTIILIQFIIYSIILIFLINFNLSYSILLISFLSIILTLNLQIMFITMIEDIIKRNKILIKTSIIYTLGLVISYYFLERSLTIIIFISAFKYIIEIVYLMYSYELYKVDFKNVNLKLFINILKIGFPTMIMTLLITLNYNIDIFIMKFTTNNYQIGLYGVAVSLATMVWVIPDAFKDVIFNRSAKEDCIREINVAIKINIILCIVIIIGFMLLGQSFLNIMYGSEYVESYSLVVILFVGTIPMILYKLIHPLYIANGKQIIVMIILMISVMINVMLNLMTIPKMGAIGAAISSVISYTICGVIFIIKYKCDFKMVK